MARYLCIGAVVGAAVVAAPVMLLDLRTPRDFEYVLALVLLAPLYLPVGAIAVFCGLPKGAVLAAAVISNAMLYSAAGWWLWRSSGQSLLYRFGPIAAAVVAIHAIVIFESV